VAFNKAFQSSSSRSWELDVASIAMSESLFVSVALTQAMSSHDDSCVWHLPVPLLRTEGQCARLLEASLAEQKASTWLQGGNQCLEDLDTVFVRPVVEDPAEVVYISILDRLLFKKVVSLECHTV
jgi:hypothetical protein